MSQTIQVGDFVRLIKSNNPYVPIGTILKVESFTQITDKAGHVEVFNVSIPSKPWRKYIVHLDVVKKARYIEPEKVSFS